MKTMMKLLLITVLLVGMGCSGNGQETSADDGDSGAVLTDTDTDTVFDTTTEDDVATDDNHDAVPDTDIVPDDESEHDMDTPDQSDNDTENPDVDAAETPDNVTIIDNGDGTATAEIALHNPDDAVSAYLMDPNAGAWNYFSGATVKLGFREITTDTFVTYHTAFRFVNLPVKNGALIHDVALSFMPHNNVDSSETIYLHISGELQSDSSAFDVSDYNSGRPDQRVTTEAHISEWGLHCIAGTGFDPCYGGEDYCEQRAKDCWDSETRYVVPRDLSAIVSEITALSEWESGNALTLFITGMYPSTMPEPDKPDHSGTRTVVGYDMSNDKGMDYLPVLRVTYEQ